MYIYISTSQGSTSKGLNLVHIYIMDFVVENHYEPNSTPKLSLYKLPHRPREPLHMLTPPLRPSAAIPFQWEEAPGKPRATTMAAAAAPPPATPPSSKNKTARCLDLPPRLLHDDAKITIMPSPTTVLDGPYVGRSLSLACTFSFRKGMVTAREDGPRPGKRGSGGNFGSERWGSFREEGKFCRGSSDFSHSLGEIFKIDNVKITRVRRRRSFFSMSTIKSNLWGDIYSSLKQAVPWRRR